MKAIYKQAMDRALSNGEKYHVACIVYRKKKPVYIGVNSSKQDLRFVRRVKDGTLVSCLHAEMDALRYTVNGDHLEVIRFLKDGSMTMARPCAYCQAHIDKSGVTKVTYTNWEGDFVDYL
jgi:deoxycytidylate deaminase